MLTADKTLGDIRNELERGVFLALYRTRTQRLRRLVAQALLLGRYLLRGLLLLWPFYAVLLAMLLLPGARQYLPYLVLLLPGVLVWLLICVRGARLEYRQEWAGRLLQVRDLTGLLRVRNRNTKPS